MATVVLPVLRSPMISSRWPRPMGVMASMALMPVCSGSLDGLTPDDARCLDLQCGGSASVTIGPLPSMGSPRAFTTRPSSASPTGTDRMRPVARPPAPPRGVSTGRGRRRRSCPRRGSARARAVPSSNSSSSLTATPRQAGDPGDAVADLDDPPDLLGADRRACTRRRGAPAPAVISSALIVSSAIRLCSLCLFCRTAVRRPKPEGSQPAASGARAGRRCGPEPSRPPGGHRCGSSTPLSSDSSTSTWSSTGAPTTAPSDSASSARWASSMGAAGANPGDAPATGLRRELDQVVQGADDVARPSPGDGVAGDRHRRRRDLALQQLGDQARAPATARSRSVERAAQGGGGATIRAKRNRSSSIDSSSGGLMSSCTAEAYPPTRWRDWVRLRVGSASRPSARSADTGREPRQRPGHLLGGHGHDGERRQPASGRRDLAVEQVEQDGAASRAGHRGVGERQPRSGPLDRTSCSIASRSDTVAPRWSRRRSPRRPRPSTPGRSGSPARPAPAAAPPLVSARSAATASSMRSWWASAFTSRPMTRSIWLERDARASLAVLSDVKTVIGDLEAGTTPAQLAEDMLSQFRLSSSAGNTTQRGWT